ncbi:MAG: hypothetical protein CM1200mP22_18200 [Dehalococcoidia bacterium]|nr:MAG: hypothetical protein CM1200mP22_18200 [Dehalococcoidia bacterium]
MLAAWGAELAPFSPLQDETLPSGANGIYLGGGFPELFADQLAGNKPMHYAIRQAVVKGVPVYAECGGLMYLGKSLSDLEGVTHPMLGIIPAESAMSQSRLTLGYRKWSHVLIALSCPKGRGLKATSFIGLRWPGSRITKNRSIKSSTKIIDSMAFGLVAFGRRMSTSIWEVVWARHPGSWRPAPRTEFKI